MASRRNNLFAGYDAQTSRNKSSSPAPSRFSQTNNNNGYALGPSSTTTTTSSTDSPFRPNTSTSSFGAYPSNTSTPTNNFRSATPNRKGQYSDAVLSELENQNEEELQGMSARVAMLKSITVAIGDEIRDSTALAEKMNDTFENTRVRLRGTMNRMLRMAEKTGISWKVWLIFFAAVVGLFIWVRLF